jgi:hypothetical protein
MPDIPCKSCRGVCGFLCHSQFCMSFMIAWANDETLPVCDSWQESTFHGLEGVRP